MLARRGAYRNQVASRPAPVSLRPNRAAQLKSTRAFAAAYTPIPAKDHSHEHSHAAANNDHAHGNQRGPKTIHPALEGEDPEFINHPQDAYYVRSISPEQKATNKDLDDAYRHSSVYIKAEQIAPPGVYDELRAYDVLGREREKGAKEQTKNAEKSRREELNKKGWKRYLPF